MCVIVTITGMQGIGKTLLLQNLAAMTAMNGYTTGCMTTDMSYPEIQSKFFGTIIDPMQSIEKQFWAEEPTSLFTPVKNIKNLYISGVPANTEVDAYIPPDSDMKQQSFFKTLKMSDFDYIFVEAGQAFMNSLSCTAIEESDLSIFHVEVTNKGQAWFDAYSKFLYTLCDTRGMLITTTETWHHFDKKEAAALYRLGGFHVPFSAYAGIGGERGVPLVCSARQGQLLDKEDKQYIQTIGAIQAYIANEDWRKNTAENRNSYITPDGGFARNRRKQPLQKKLHPAHERKEEPRKAGRGGRR